MGAVCLSIREGGWSRTSRFATNVLLLLVGIATSLTAGASLRSNHPAGQNSSDLLPRLQQVIAEKEYEATPNSKGLQAPNRAQNLRTYFTTSGIRVVDRTAHG